jgi:hypothetical protein
MTPNDLTLSKISRILLPWMLIPVRHTRVSPRQARKIDILDVFVDQRYVVMIGNKRCKRGEACDRKVRALPQQADAVLHAPKGDVETGINDNDVGHDRLPAQA